MTHLITFVAAPQSQALASTVVDACHAKISEVYGAQECETRWLAENEACEVTVRLNDGEALKQLLAELDTIASQHPIDIHAQPLSNGPRIKALLVADMENTIIQEELIDELAAELNFGNEIAEVTRRAMRGELDFAEALSARVAKFTGVTTDQLNALYAKRVTLMPGAETLVRTMRTLDAKTALVSGGFTIFADRVAHRLGFDYVHANTLAFTDDQLTGQVIPPILDRAGKAEKLRALAAENNISIVDTLAVGDGANDLDMIAAAGLGVAFRAKPVVTEHSDASVHHGDLTSLLYLQGIAQEQFSTS